MSTTLAYEISRDFGNKHCDQHRQGISTSMFKQNAIVRVCCLYFRDEMQQTLINRYGEDKVRANVRFRLPFAEPRHEIASGQVIDW
jgi:hypothetical protein